MIHRHKMCSLLKQYLRKHKSIKKIHRLEVIIRWSVEDPNLSMDEVRISNNSIMFNNKNSQTNHLSQKVPTRMLTSKEWIKKCRINKFRRELKLDCKKIWIRCLIYLRCLSGLAGHRNLNICLILFKIKGKHPNLTNDSDRKIRKSYQKRYWTFVLKIIYNLRRSSCWKLRLIN